MMIRQFVLRVRAQHSILHQSCDQVCAGDLFCHHSYTRTAPSTHTLGTSDLTHVNVSVRDKTHFNNLFNCHYLPCSKYIYYVVSGKCCKHDKENNNCDCISCQFQILTEFK